MNDTPELILFPSGWRWKPWDKERIQIINPDNVRVGEVRIDPDDHGYPWLAYFCYTPKVSFRNIFGHETTIELARMRVQRVLCALDLAKPSDFGMEAGS